MSISNKNLQSAKTSVNDEFYTRLEDIERELAHYKSHFHGKTVFLNCDDPYESNFFKYFAMSFNHLGLKKLIAMSYSGSPIVGSQLPLFEIAGLDGSKSQREPYKVVITEVPDHNKSGALDMADVDHLLMTDANSISPLNGNGDFRSAESIELLLESDIVVTNPPFSLFQEFLSLLFQHGKKFLIIGNMNTGTSKGVWPYFRDGKMWLGVTRNGSGAMWFRVSESAPVKSGQKVIDGVRHQTIGSSAWFTNLDHAQRHREMPLFRRYSDDPGRYPKYSNYDAIEVKPVDDIPVDYFGAMGVPITFLGKHNPDQFDIVGVSGDLANPIQIDGKRRTGRFYLGNRRMFERVVIRRKNAD